MEAKELRIGNYVYSNKFVIKSYGVDGFINILKNIDNFTPIPLTGEWLVKFGFEEALNGWWSDNEIWSYNDGKFYLGANTYLSNVKYVHQLQNLYSALTNEELTLK